METCELDLDIPNNLLLEAYASSVRHKRLGKMIHWKPNDLWNNWFHAWFRDNFYTKHLESIPRFSFLETAPNMSSSSHVDVVNADFKDGRGKRIHIRMAVINKTLPPTSGCFEYTDKNGNVLSRTGHTGLSIYKTDVHHRANNEGSDIPRRIFSIGFYEDSYEKLVTLKELGKLIK